MEILLHWDEQDIFQLTKFTSARAVDFSVDFLLPSVGFLSFLPPARLFPVPREIKHLNFLIWSCKRGEGNTTTFRGLVEEQLEVHMGCLQA